LTLSRSIELLLGKRRKKSPGTKNIASQATLLIEREKSLLQWL